MSILHKEMVCLGTCTFITALHVTDSDPDITAPASSPSQGENIISSKRIHSPSNRRRERRKLNEDVQVTTFMYS